ncbi:MAG TPA: ComEC/Rec2 family competence protein [Rhizomicrobium sp.]|nr:ComEC/Rec2 family competence protein [Rhizomicrobium sp.]
MPGAGALVARLRGAFAHPLASLGEAALAERERWPLWLAPGLAAGIGFYFALPVEPALWIAFVMLAASFSCTIAATRFAHPAVAAVLALCAAFALGFSVAKFRTDLIARPVLSHKIGYAGFTARVESIEQHGKGMRAVLGHLEPERHLSGTIPWRVRLYFRNVPSDLEPGSWISFRASLMTPPAPAAPGDYDFGRWAFYEGIGAVGFSFGQPKLIAAQEDETFTERWNARLERLRNAMTARVREILPGSEGGVSAAMITGETGGIDAADYSAYRDSGLVHVLSISGLHLALAGGFFFWIVRAILALFPPIALNYPIKKWAAVAALLGAAFYLFISGCEAPALRSYIMIAMMFLAILADRPALSMRSVMIAATFILLIEPESLTEPGFEMSFAAVIGLIAIAEWGEKREKSPDGVRLGPVRKIWRYMIGIVIASIVATLATTPFAIFHFDRSTQYGAISNLASLPIADFVIMPAATLAMIAMPFGLERWPLLVMGKGVVMMTAVAHWVSKLPGAASVAVVWPEYALVVVAIGGLWIAFWRRPWRWLGFAPIFIGIVATFFTARPDLMIDRDAKTIALRLPDGSLGFVREPQDDYAAEIWLRRDGDAREVQQAIAKPGQGVRCDELGCIATLASGETVAAIARSEALEDCASADILISAVPTRRRCEGPKLVIDRFDLAKNGGYAIWLKDGAQIQTVEGERGQRPWSQPIRTRTGRFNSGE